MKPQHFLVKARAFMNSKAVSAIDWLFAIGTIAWGAYLLLVLNDTDWTSYALIVAGCVGLLLAAIKPSKRIESALQKRFIQRS